VLRKVCITGQLPGTFFFQGTKNKEGAGLSALGKVPVIRILQNNPFHGA
jgi:hypothetical protein